MLALASSGDYFAVKGVIENLLSALRVDAEFEFEPTRQPLLGAAACQFTLDGQMCGYLGEVSDAGKKSFGLRVPMTVAELDIAVISRRAELVPQYRGLSPFPAIQRDLNMVMDEAIAWSHVSRLVRTAAGDVLDRLTHREIYRDPRKDGEGKKRVIFSFSLRAADRTLTSDEADAVLTSIVERCHEELGAVLLN
jgi:phenylalanyl-tRNA synthetase beta chain